MRKYRLVAKKGEGTFSEVLKAQNIKTGTFYAIKCMKSSYKSKDEVSNLREIQAIKRLSPHPNIVKLEEVLFDPPTGRLALVFELLEGNLYELMKDRKKHFSKATVKSFVRQILKSLDHMHKNNVFHRDIKPENILVDKQGRNLKLADFGSCRGITSKPPFTEYISTRWYRPPECLLTSGMYGSAMDIWGMGAILFELTTLYPLSPGSDEADQINRIHRVLGTPKASVVSKLRKHASPQTNFAFPKQEGIGLAKLLPGASDNCLDLLQQTLAYDSSERITARKAMSHPYFVGDHPQPTSNGFKSTTSSKSNNASTKTKGSRTRRAKIAPSTHDISSSSSLPTNTAKTVMMAESDKASGPMIQQSAAKAVEEPSPPITKPRSMVSILLARSSKDKLVKDNKARNRTIYRKGGKSNSNPSLQSSSTSSGSNLPRLKSLIPESKDEDKKKVSSDNNNPPSFRKHSKKKFNIRSSGYGSSSVAPLQGASSSTKLPSLSESNTLKSKTKRRSNGRRLPPITRGRRGLR